MEKYLSVLKSCPFFDGMDDGEILSVLHCIDARRITKESDEYIFHVGDHTDSMGLVLSGSVLIIQEDVWGHRNILAKVEAGDFFAEAFAAAAASASVSASDSGAGMNISVVAEEKSEIYLLNVSRLLTTCPTVCAHHNRLIRNLVSVLAGKVLLFNEKITYMGKRTTKEKLLSYLSSEAMKRGSLSFEIPYDRQQLADFLGVDRAAMSAELSKLQKEGRIETKRNKFVLHSVETL